MQDFHEEEERGRATDVDGPKSYLHGAGDDDSEREWWVRSRVKMSMQTRGNVY